ncbi:MAG: helix-turn-helix transcriptional regulator [Enterobacteriaceae bacterium]|jgi:AraC-like DNA-binding protein|nr:helix-turn-helix transcriptional regulator [Enterobacteriaceae bacterium]
MSAVHSIYEATQSQILHQLTLSAPMLIWVRRGKKRVTAGSSQYWCNTGQCLALPMSYQFGIENIPSAKQHLYFAHCIVPPKAWTTGFLQRYGRLLPAPKQQQIVFDPSGQLVRQLEEFIYLMTMAESSDLAMVRAEHAWQQVLFTMVTEQVAHVLYSHPQENMTNTITAMLQADLSYPWYIGDLADSLHISESTLRRKLIEEKTSFTQILHNLRMSHAAHLLITTSHTIQYIALEVSYSSSSKFTARFEQQFGMTPKALRKTI